VIDAFFMIDILINFRTIYFDPKTELAVTDDKKIALNYILRGRFFIDIIASLPVAEIYAALASSTSSNNNKNLRFISMLKLVRILRIGRMITYIRMN
jgi:hypothetical protein